MVDRKMDACMSVFMADCQDNGRTQEVNNGLCLDYYIGDNSGCANTVIEPGYSLDRDWDVAPTSDGPQIEAMDGFLRYHVENQSGRNLWLNINAKREYSTSNSGCVLRFSVRCNQVESSEVKFSLPGGVILRWDGSSFSYQERSSGFHIGSSSISPDGQWHQIVMVLTGDHVSLLEDGSERFGKITDVGASVTPRFSMQALDQGSNLSFDLKNIFIFHSCEGSTITMPTAVYGNDDHTKQTTPRPRAATYSLMHPSLPLGKHQWYVDSNTKELKSVSDGQCLDVTSNGKLYMQECLGGANQKFMFMDEQARHHQSYEWIVRKEVGEGFRDDGFFCPAGAVEANWKPIQAIDGAYHEIGINRNVEFPYWEQTSSWEDSVATSVTSGFQFGNRGVTVPWIDAKEMETSVRDVLHDLEFIDGGDLKSDQAWQFVYEISDVCTSMWELKTKDIVVTSDADHEPCCLPGQELDPGQPHGACKSQSACQCEDSVCYPPSDLTSTPAPNPVGETPSVSGNDTNFGGKPSPCWVRIVALAVVIVHYRL